MSDMAEFRKLGIGLFVIILTIQIFAILILYNTKDHLSGYAFSDRQMNMQKRLKTELKRAAKERKTVVVWLGNGRFSERLIKYAKYLQASCPKEKCGSCWFTTNSSLVDHNSTAAVLFLYKILSRSTMPKNRRNDQLYVWWTSESPANLLHAKKKNLMFEDTLQFNLTWSYRRDAGIYVRYGGNNLYRKLLVNNLKWILPTKKGWGAAAISDCNAFNGPKYRLEYIKQIRNSSGNRLQTIGNCFGAKTLDEASFLSFLSEKKFFFAFENSYHCRDYITEKFFINGLKNSVVPVVWGATKKDYEAVAPPHSFIYAEDFASIPELVRYLDYLDTNDTAYLKYFEWRLKEPEDFPEITSQACRLCRIVHGINVDDMYDPNYNHNASSRPLFTKNVAVRTIPRLSDWVYKKENRECLVLPRVSPMRKGGKAAIIKKKNTISKWRN